MACVCDAEFSQENHPRWLGIGQNFWPVLCMGQACEWHGHPHDDADDEADDAWEDAPQLRGAVSSLVVCETGVDWDEPDMV